ncbi:MAG: hypothetical protein B5M53_06675 [Candidatus Cloacimonas sp. 4484_209]|nr:MAG: hypothetical protein B5M53_06675 [Candidatus Cloacimonas sp. 4484_209]
MDNKKEPEEKISKEEIERFLADREKIRKIVGNIGGKPTRNERIVNIIFFAIVAALFIISFIPHGISKIIGIEIAIFLVSLKLVYFLYNEARVNHFQFWVLSTLEWRINDISKTLKEIMKMLETLKAEQKEKKDDS